MPVSSIAELKAYVDAHFWKGEEVAGWVKRLFFQRGDHQQTSAGSASQGLPIVLDSGGLIDASFIDDSDIDHGTIGGLADNDHPQYGLIAAANTWTQLNQFNPANTTGVGLGVTRNLTATSTDSPVAYILQDHTSDDQDALRVGQDGTGNIASFYDGATLVMSLIDGGKLGVGTVAGGAPTGVFHAQAPLFADTPLFERGPTTTAGFLASTRLKATKSTDMADGFGPAFSFSIQDDALVDNAIGAVGFYRAGADNTGKFVIQSVLAGANVQTLWLTAGAILSVGVETVGASRIGGQAGSSTNDFAVGGVLYEDHATNANGTTVETDLSTYTVPANTLSANGMSLEFEAWWTLTNNANTKTTKLYFGSDNWTMPSTTGAAPTIYLKGYIVRTGAATQDVFYTVGLSGASPTHVFSTATRTLSGSNVLKLTGQSSAAGNDVKQEFFIVRWNDANT